MDADEDSLYREIIIENWQHPSNQGVVPDPDFEVRQENPLCGDRIHLTGRIKDGKLADIAFTNEGCAISTASASILTERIKGQPLAEVKKLTEADVLDGLGIILTPARAKCALLAYKALTRAI